MYAFVLPLTLGAVLSCNTKDVETKIMTPRFLYAFCLLFLPTSLIGAQGFVERIEPSVVERGKTTRVTIYGSHLGKPVTLWSSITPGRITATPYGEATATKAVLDVTIAKETPVGICGVRLATEDGLSNACLLLIDDLPVKPLTGKTTLPVAMWGRFREAVVDRITIEVTAGERVSFEAVANRLGKDVDPLVTIRDAKGKLVAEHDNDPGLYFDCRFEHAFVNAGTYTVEIRDARFHGSEHGQYVLRMGKFPAARVAVPMAVRAGKRVSLRLPDAVDFDVPMNATGLFFGVVKRPGDQGSAWLPLEAGNAEVTLHRAAGGTIDEGTSAVVPGKLCGVLQKPGERHYYRMELTKGQQIQIRADARLFNSPAELEIAVTDAKGKELRRASENAQEETTLDFTANAPGIYGLTVRDVHRDGGPAFAYRLDVRVPSPMVQITADVEGLTVPRGDYQPIPLTVTRMGHAGKIALSLVDAPPGVRLAPNEIDAGINAIVCKLHAASDSPIGIHTLQIVATGFTEPVFVRTKPLIDRQIVNVDLIPHALREDQRRLPPSLTDRFAMQITPPSFFTFELPQAQATLGRYQHVEFPIALARTNGFDGTITYHAKGGQLAPKEEGRTRVYADFGKDRGSIHSKILTNLGKHRVDVTAVGSQAGRKVALTRTFDLDIKSAFNVIAEPALIKMEPGATAKLRLVADRLKNFDADVTVQITPVLGFDLPDQIVIPRGQTGVDISVRIPSDRAPGRQSITFIASAVVNGFEEEQRGRIDIDIVKMPSAKK